MISLRIRSSFFKQFFGFSRNQIGIIRDFLRFGYVVNLFARESVLVFRLSNFQRCFLNSGILINAAYLWSGILDWYRVSCEFSKEQRFVSVFGCRRTFSRLLVNVLVTSKSQLASKWFISVLEKLDLFSLGISIGDLISLCSWLIDFDDLLLTLALTNVRFDLCIKRVLDLIVFSFQLIDLLLHLDHFP